MTSSVTFLIPDTFTVSQRRHQCVYLINHMLDLSHLTSNGQDTITLNRDNILNHGNWECLVLNQHITHITHTHTKHTETKQPSQRKHSIFFGGLPQTQDQKKI